MNDHYVCTVEVSPDEVDAGADITLAVHVDYSGDDEPKQPGVSIRSRDGAELARAALAQSEDDDDDGYEADDIVLSAPQSVGEHIYRAVVVVPDKDGVLQDQAATEVRLVVKAHEAELNVWDVPNVMVPGERFRFTVALKCSAGCNLAGRELNIVDREGAAIGCATLGPTVWPGTDALYFAEVEAEAPGAAGDHRWEINTGESTAGLPHAAGTLPVALKVVHPPNCEVTVEVIDREKQAPIKGARVVAHPYRAMTGEDGTARFKVNEGRYDMLVSATKYAPFSIMVEVRGDVVTRAELDVEPPLEDPDE
jgi:hypothetical protein